MIIANTANNATYDAARQGHPKSRRSFGRGVSAEGFLDVAQGFLP